MTFRVSNGNKTYLPSNICDSSDRSDSSDGNDISDSCDSSDSSDSSDSRDISNNSDSSDSSNNNKKLFSQFFILIFSYIFFVSQKNQKLKLWWNSKTQIVMKLQITNCDQTQKLKL